MKLQSPFLKKIKILPERVKNWNNYPFSIPVFSKIDFELNMNNSVTIIVGGNGSGKSTLLEAIASNCGFSTSGGTRNHVIFEQEEEALSNFLRFSWLPKMSSGFFFRAETFSSFARDIDSIHAHDGYGGKSLRKQSHGEAFSQIFSNRFGRRGIYILDEPESALSPQRQVDLICLINELQKTGECQFIIATHSPLLMAIPGADLKMIKDDEFVSCDFHETDHFKLLRDFYLYPDGFIQGLLIDEDTE